MSKLLKTIAVCGLIAMMPGCGKAPELGAALGGESDMRIGGVQAGPWWLTLAEKGGKSDIIHIYIEGDGRAYITAGEPSGNPTPKNPVALDLARADRADVPVIYLARPCQYANLKGQPCTQDVWTAKRFDETVMAAYTAAVSRLLSGAVMPENGANVAVKDAQVAGKRAVLVGYSGGAVIALEVAKRLPQVVGVVTVAGNLDPEATNTWHRVSAMPTATRPYQYPGRLASLPVLHLVGTEDEIVRPELSRQVLDAAGPLACTKLQVVPGATHHQGWLGVWPAEPPRCD